MYCGDLVSWPRVAVIVSLGFTLTACVSCPTDGVATEDPLLGPEAGEWWRAGGPTDEELNALDAPIDDPLVPPGAPNDPLMETAWHLRRIRAQEAWSLARGSGVVVGVVDSGCDTDHRELFSVCRGGIDLLRGDNDPDDELGHGTALAGIVAGLAGNGVGAAGVAPEAFVVPIKIVGSPEATAPAPLVANGIDEAIARGAEIVLVGVAAERASPELEASIAAALAAGVIVVAPAGNRKSQLDMAPASLAGVLSVAASSRRDLPSLLTNFTSVTSLFAPGEEIPVPDVGGGFAEDDGSSFAAAVAAGAAALIRSANPALAADQVQRLLVATAEPLRDADGGPLSLAGRIQVERAVQRAISADQEASIDGLEVLPRRPLAGQSATIRVEVTGGGLTTAAGSLQLALTNGEFSPGISEILLPVTAPLGDTIVMEVAAVFTAPAPTITADLQVEGDTQPENNTLALDLTLSSEPSPDLEITSFTMPTLRSGEDTASILVEVTNVGTAEAVARPIELYGDDALITSSALPALNAGARANAELVIALPASDVEEASSPRLYSIRVTPTVSELNHRFNALQLYMSLGSDDSRLSPHYADLPGNDVETDAPWRLDPAAETIPFLIVFFDTVDLQRVEFYDLDPGTNRWNQFYLSKPGPSLTVPADTRIYGARGEAGGVNESGRILPVTPLDGVLRVGATTHLVIEVPKNALFTFPSGGQCRLTPCTFVLTRVRYCTPGACRKCTCDWFEKVLRVGRHIHPLPSWFTGDDPNDDRYYDPHTHTISEWTNVSVSLAKKNYGGPIEMMRRSARAMGFIEGLDVKNRLVTTDHSFYYVDTPGPPFGAPCVVGSVVCGAAADTVGGPAGNRKYSTEFAAYGTIFGETRGQEAYIDLGLAGGTIKDHLLAYRLDEVLPGFAISPHPVVGLTGEPAAVGALTPNLPDALDTIRRDSDAFSFAAHPRLSGTLSWPEAKIDEALSFDAFATAAHLRTASGGHQEFVFNGLQWWNQRILHERSGLGTTSMRHLNPFAVGDPAPFPSLRARSWVAAARWQRTRDANFTSWLSDVQQGLRRKLVGERNRTFIRKVYGLAATDAHGDFNYTSDVELTFTQQLGKRASVNDNAWFLTRTYSYLEPRGIAHGRKWRRSDGLDAAYFDETSGVTGLFERMRHGAAVMTDGPLPLFVLDAQTRFDSESFEYDELKNTFSSPNDAFANIDGRMGGWGDRDGQLTALVPLTPPPPCGEGVSHRTYNNYLLGGWENTSDFGGTPTKLTYYVVRQVPAIGGPGGINGGPEGFDMETIPDRKVLTFKRHSRILEAGPSAEEMIVAPGGFLRPHAIVLEARATSHVGLTNPLYVIPEIGGPDLLQVDGDLATFAGCPRWINAAVPAAGLKIEFRFAVSMSPDDPAEMGIKVNQLDKSGHATAETAITPAWHHSWSGDSVRGANTVLTLENALAIPLDVLKDYHPHHTGPQLIPEERGPQAFTLVVYLERPRDSRGNRLNPIAELVASRCFATQNCF